MCVSFSSPLLGLRSTRVLQMTVVNVATLPVVIVPRQLCCPSLRSRLGAVAVTVARRGRSQGREGLSAVAAVVRLPGLGFLDGIGRVVRFEYEMSRLILRGNLPLRTLYSVIWLGGSPCSGRDGFGPHSTGAPARDKDRCGERHRLGASLKLGPL